jgi:hypothetical protein
MYLHQAMHMSNNKKIHANFDLSPANGDRIGSNPERRIKFSAGMNNSSSDESGLP